VKWTPNSAQPLAGGLLPIILNFELV